MSADASGLRDKLEVAAVGWCQDLVDEVTTRLRSNAPVDSGALLNSIQPEAARATGSGASGAVRVGVDYASFVDTGTRYFAGTRFFEDVVDAWPEIVSSVR